MSDATRRRSAIEEDERPMRPVMPYWREVAITAPTIFVLVVVVGWLLRPLLSGLPPLAATAATVLVVVMLMTKPVMPFLTRSLDRFLVPRRRST